MDKKKLCVAYSFLRLCALICKHKINKYLNTFLINSHPATIPKMLPLKRVNKFLSAETEPVAL